MNPKSQVYTAVVFPSRTDKLPFTGGVGELQTEIKMQFVLFDMTMYTGERTSSVLPDCEASTGQSLT